MAWDLSIWIVLSLFHLSNSNLVQRRERLCSLLPWQNASVGISLLWEALPWEFIPPGSCCSRFPQLTRLSSNTKMENCGNLFFFFAGASKIERRNRLKKAIRKDLSSWQFHCFAKPTVRGSMKGKKISMNMEMLFGLCHRKYQEEQGWAVLLVLTKGKSLYGSNLRKGQYYGFKKARCQLHYL